MKDYTINDIFICPVDGVVRPCPCKWEICKV